MNYNSIIASLFVFISYDIAFSTSNLDCIDSLTPEERQSQLDQKLLASANNGELEDVIQLVKEGANVNATNRYLNTPLHLAVDEGHYDIVKILIENGADVNAQNKIGNTPAHIAVREGQIPIVELFLRKKKEGLNIDFNIKNKDGETPLELAEKRNKIIIRKLLSGEFEPRKRPPTKLDDEILAVATSGDMKRVLEIIEEDHDMIYARNKHWGTPLHLAVQHRHYDIAKILIENGADVNAQNVYGNTPLHQVTTRNIAELLVLNGAIVDIKNDSGQTPADTAEEKKMGRIVDFLKYGDELPTTRYNSLSPGLEKQLIKATEYGNLGEIQRLIENHDINIANITVPIGKSTLLHIAAKKGYYDIAKILLKKAPELLNATNAYLSTPLYSAILGKHYDIVELLIENGADINIKNIYGNAPLHSAVLVTGKKQIPIIELFLRKKKEGFNIDFNIKNKKGETPLELAEKSSRSIIIVRKLLIGEFEPRKRYPTKLDKEILEVATSGDLTRVREIIAEDPYVVHARNSKWSVPLHLALQHRHYDVVEVLIENVADVNAKNMNGNTPSHIATDKGETFIIELFLRKKKEGFNIDFDIENDKGETPLAIAEKKERRVIIKKLLTGEFEPRKRYPTKLDKEILEVAKSGDMKRVLEIIEEDPDVIYARNTNWSTPLHLATRYGHHDIAKVLIEKGIDINAKNMNGNTPSHVAADRDQRLIMELFLRKKKEGFNIDFSTENDKGETPLAIAKKKGFTAMIKLLSR